MKFKELIAQINEDKSVDYNGLTVYGKVVTVTLEKGKHNDLMSINVSGTERTLKMKSAETLKGEHNEEDWQVIEQLYNQLATKRAAQIEKLVDSFEKDLNKIVVGMEKDITSLFNSNKKLK